MKIPAALLVLVVTAICGAMARAAQDAYTAELASMINDYRAQNGLKPLALAPPLSALAHEHASRMAQQHRLSHDGFQQRFAKAGARTCVENVGNHPTPIAEFEGWRKSPTHNRNLLDPGIARMGLAVEGRYVAFLACS